MSSAITSERLAEIEAREKAATPGPWTASMSAIWSEADVTTPVCDLESSRTLQAAGDLAFIAAARTDIPDLIARVRELEAENERFREADRQRAIERAGGEAALRGDIRPAGCSDF